MARSARLPTSPRLRVDLAAEVLWRDDLQVRLRPRTWAVLRYLVERPGVLVTKRALLDAVWGSVCVTEGTLSKSIAELRDAVGDDPGDPRFIVTVHRRGFRYVGRAALSGGESLPSPSRAFTQQAADAAHAALVGRSDALDTLAQAFAEARDGARRLVFIKGEPGIGKTTLVEAFQRSLADFAEDQVAFATGSAVSELGDVAPLFPIVEATRSLAIGPHRAAVVDALRDAGPAWFYELLGVPRALAAEVAGGQRPTPTEMLVGIARVLDALATVTPLVLVLEDLHWADPSTINLLSVLVRGRQRSRLLVVVTYRPAEDARRGDRIERLRREISRDKRLVDLPLDRFSVGDTADWLGDRFAGIELPEGLAAALFAHTGGNPLFLSAVVDHLCARQWLRHGDARVQLDGPLDRIADIVPTDLAGLVQNELRDLTQDEISVLQAASIAGVEFSAQEVAAALEADAEEVERRLVGLASSQRFVRAAGAEAWPDGTLGSRWCFGHSLYRRALLESVPVVRSQRLHQRIGERIEAGWAARSEEVASLLAAHFEASRDAPRALRHLDAAARIAERRSAPAEARHFLVRALACLPARPEDPAAAAAHDQRELDLRVRIALAIGASDGYANPEMREHLVRSIELCGGEGLRHLRFRLGFALVSTCIANNERRVWVEFHALREQAEDLGSGARLLCDLLSGVIALLEGRYRDAVHLENLVGAADLVDDDLYVGSRFDVVALGWSAIRRCAIGDAAGARGFAAAALERARTIPDRLNEAFALFCAAQVAVWLRDRQSLAEFAVRSEALTREFGHRQWGDMVRLASFRSEALDDPRRGFQALLEEARGARIASAYRALLCSVVAEAALADGRIAEGLSIVEQGLDAIERGFARLGHAELLRTRADLHRAAGAGRDIVRSDLEAAREIAARGGADSLAATLSAEIAGP